MSDIKLDRFDISILKQLQEDASVSNFELSKIIGLSPSATLHRVRNLKESGVIQKSTTVLDEKKLGIETVAYVMLNLSPANRTIIEEFLQQIHSLREVQECYALAGNHDYLLRIVAKDVKTYRDFLVDSIMSNPNIAGLETSIVIGVDKRELALPLFP